DAVEIEAALEEIGRQVGERSLDGGGAVERIAAPRRVEVSMLDDLRGGVAQRLARRAAAEPATQEAAHALGRVGERRLEPGGEGLADQPVGLLAGRDLEQRIDAGGYRLLAQEVRAERVDGADARGLQLGERVVEPGGLELGTQPQLQIPG